tara:strand:+ start:611 stop:943 length:333 start_codon:yes stop_codon:yes gene_type:complete
MYNNQTGNKSGIGIGDKLDFVRGLILDSVLLNYKKDTDVAIALEFLHDLRTTIALCPKEDEQGGVCNSNIAKYTSQTKKNPNRDFYACVHGDWIGWVDKIDINDFIGEKI